VYARYQERMHDSDAMDFDDLLMNMVLLVDGHDQVCAELADRFRYVLVDEYQDTNHAQYRIIRALTVKSRNLHVTGDPDQSIYRWRGADIGNILSFENDFPDAEVIVLLGRLGLRVTETAVVVHPRRAGRSMYSVGRSLYYPFKVTLATLVAVLRALMLKKKESRR